MGAPNWFEIGLAAVIAVLGWLFKREVNRIDQIAAAYVTRESLDTTLLSMRVERREMHVENRQSLQQLGVKVDGLSDKVAAPLAVLTNRVDTLDERVEELRDFKHGHCEPAVRYVDYLQKDKPWERE